MSDSVANISPRSPGNRANDAKSVDQPGDFADFIAEAVDVSVPVRLERLANYYGQRTALVAPSHDAVTYAGLFRQISNLVGFLNGLGVGRGDRVALVLPDGPELAVAFIAIASGATCAPLNPAYREREFERLYRDLRPRALVVDRAVNSVAVGVAQRQSIPVIELSCTDDNGFGSFTLRGEALTQPAQRGFAKADDIALILFTSGTTARPKLVPLTHANLMASARNVAASLQLTADDRCLNIMPLFHIHGLVGGLLASVMSGASVVCPAGFCAVQFFDWLQKFQPTWYSAVPTMHQAILTRAQANIEIIRRHPLRFIRSSSGALPTKVMAELEKTFAAPVVDSYGMTESAHQVASNPLPPGQRKPGSVGRAAGPEIAIMDQSSNLQPAGTIGEVVIRGANVIRGYGDSMDTNAEALTHGWFRTGDQGYLDGDGFLFLTGRLKEMINRAGEKISPREIDEVIAAHPAIEQAVTFAVSNPVLGEEVATAVVLQRGAQITAGELREFAATHLAGFKVPAQVVIVGNIPMGATGKLQRIGLAEKLGIAAVDQLPTGATKGYMPPETKLEKEIASIWAQVLSLERVGRHDNFFALGGQSLSAMQIMARVHQALQVEIPLQTMFAVPTIERMAAVIREHQARRLADTNLLRIVSELETITDEEAERMLEHATGRTVD
jgi:acyl-CoA synthetase (AMP-forming)/AMP-acid ligase II/acyl carrier protein